MKLHSGNLNTLLTEEFLLNGTVENETSISILISTTNSNNNNNNNSEEILGDIFCSGLPYQNGTNMLAPFLLCGVLTLVINTLGVIGNTMSLCILTKSFSKVSIVLYLIGLSVCDTTMLLVDIFCFVLPVIFKYYQTFHYYTDIFVPSVAPYAYPFADFGITGSTYFTVAITIDRYILVCSPLHAKSSCTMKRARYSSIFIIILSFLYNVPRFLEYTTVSIDDDGNPPFHVKVTEFGASLYYKQWYLLFAWFIFLFIIPFIILFSLNFLICHRVRKANLKRRSLSSSTRPRPRPATTGFNRINNTQPSSRIRTGAGTVIRGVIGAGFRQQQQDSSFSKQSLSITYMCVSLVIVFLVCNVPFFINRIVQEFLILTPIPYVVYTSNILTSINASVNWIIYCLFGKKFRVEFLKVLSSPCCFYCILTKKCGLFNNKEIRRNNNVVVENNINSRHNRIPPATKSIIVKDSNLNSSNNHV